ncbi:MAG TPA: aminotransferase class I/II-fold pyridoxal phosphate-dependent enzyme, partial [Anaerolineae bacterium]
TGWRLGAAIGPKEVAQVISKLNTNDESCTAHFVQWAGIEALQGDQSGAAFIMANLRRQRDAAVEMLHSIDGMTLHKPETTFYLFPNVTTVMERLGFTDVADFADAALKNACVSFCTRKHFGRPQPGEKEQYIRLAYSGIDEHEIRTGLGQLKAWIDETARTGAQQKAASPTAQA